jgi:hypothetical protein
MKNNSFGPLFLSLLIVLFASCGKDGDGGSGSSSEGRIEEQQAQGNYRAIMRPMNNSLSGFLPTGAAEIAIKDDNVKVKTYLDDDAKVPHKQTIHTGTRCPVDSDDKNSDGIIDINEAYEVVGGPLIALDADINSLVDGEGVYPMGSAYTYQQSASLAKLESDVRAAVGQNLNLGGRVVLFHGVNNATNMPESVTTRDEMRPQESVPIVCGIIERVVE